MCVANGVQPRPTQVLSTASVVYSDTRGRIAFAFTDPELARPTRISTLWDNVRLDSTGCARFSEVVSGMEAVDALYSGYGEDSGGGPCRGGQRRIVAEGDTHLDREYPLLGASRH